MLARRWRLRALTLVLSVPSVLSSARGQDSEAYTTIAGVPLSDAVIEGAEDDGRFGLPNGLQQFSILRAAAIENKVEANSFGLSRVDGINEPGKQPAIDRRAAFVIKKGFLRYENNGNVRSLSRRPRRAPCDPVIANKFIDRVDEGNINSV